MSILHKITVPDLNSTNYIENIQTQVNNINNNFEILQSLDYLKGEDGAALYIENISLNDNTKWKQKIKDCILKIDETSQNKITNTISGNQYNAFYDLDNNDNDNILCLIYKIENDEKKYISSLAYTFLDSRFTHINDIKTDVDKMNETYSHIYGDMLDCSRILIYNGTHDEFEAVQSFPTLYYDENNGFCWNIYGNQSGLPSQGVPGVNGKNGNLYIVKIDYFDGDNVIDTNNTQLYNITHYYKNSVDFNGWDEIGNISDDINGCNCIALANNNIGTEQKLWVSMIQGERNDYRVFCKDENSLRYNLNASFLKELLSTINISNNDGPKGYFLKFNEEPQDQTAHMIYAVKGDDDTDYDNLIISPVEDYNNPKNILKESPDSVGKNLVLNYENIKLYKGNELIDIDKYIANIIQITYNELVILRSKSELVPGREYRITDYITTTMQENTRSEGNQFDIIVTADNEFTLNEVARATQHDNDRYFANSDLNAWKIWYCLDNDTSRFAWADDSTTNGKGVIYRMIDEWGNDCPYDFKNIRFSIDNFADAYTFGASSIDYSTSVNNICKNNKIGKFFDSNRQKLNFILFGMGCLNNTIGSNCDNIYFSASCNNINIQDNYTHQLNSSFDKYDNTHNNTNIISGDKILFNNIGVANEDDRIGAHKTALLLGNNNNIVLSDDAVIQHCTRGIGNENMTPGGDPYSNAVTTIAWTHNGSNSSNGTGYGNGDKNPPHIGFYNQLTKSGVADGANATYPGRINICPYSTPSSWWDTYNYGLSMSKGKLYYEGNDIYNRSNISGQIGLSAKEHMSLWEWSDKFTNNSLLNGNLVSDPIGKFYSCGGWAWASSSYLYVQEHTAGGGDSGVKMYFNDQSRVIQLIENMNRKYNYTKRCFMLYPTYKDPSAQNFTEDSERSFNAAHKRSLFLAQYANHDLTSNNKNYTVELIEYPSTHYIRMRANATIDMDTSSAGTTAHLYIGRKDNIGWVHMSDVCSRAYGEDNTKGWALYNDGTIKTKSISASGSISATSGFYQSSDNRLKDFEDTIPVDLEKLRVLKKNYFTWKDKENKDRQIGVSAQEIQEIYPELVSANEDGMLSVAYDKLSVVALVAIDKLYDENQSLKKIISDFNERLNKLEQNGNRN